MIDFVVFTVLFIYFIIIIFLSEKFTMSLILISELHLVDDCILHICIFLQGNLQSFPVSICDEQNVNEIRGTWAGLSAAGLYCGRGATGGYSPRGHGPGDRGRWTGPE